MAFLVGVNTTNTDSSKIKYRAGFIETVLLFLKVFQKELNNKDSGKEEIKVALGISVQNFKDMFIVRKLLLKCLSSNKS